MVSGTHTSKLRDYIRRSTAVIVVVGNTICVSVMRKLFTTFADNFGWSKM